MNSYLYADIIISAKHFMSLNLLEDIKQQAYSLISELDTLNKEDLTHKLNLLEPKNVSEAKTLTKQIILNAKQLTLVWVDLMVQDIREQEYSYSYLIKSPINPESEVIVLKYGGNYSEETIEKIESGNYESLMISGEVVICCTEKYLTPWAMKSTDAFTQIKMIIKNNNELKLGQRFQALCVWNPNHSCLQFIRYATPQQSLQFLSHSNHKQIEHNHYKTIKNKIIHLFEKVFSSNYAHALLFTIINDSSFFIDGPNISNIIRDILPRVCELKVHFPFKNSFFPFKNSQSQLVETPMQMSSSKTFTILDFSHLTEKKQIKICGEEIDNLKALKVFVEEGLTIYRWEYGESQFPHNHSGIIVKASSILVPNFKSDENFSNEQIFENPFENLEEEEKNEIREYFDMCQSFDPKLQDVQREKITELIEIEIEKQKNEKIDFENLMLFAKMNARSEGRDNISVEDYAIGKKIVLKQ